MDLPFAQTGFCSTEGIAKLEALSGHGDASFGTTYRMLIKELRFLARSVAVVGKGGVLRYLQLVPEVGQEPSDDEALAAVRKAMWAPFCLPSA